MGVFLCFASNLEGAVADHLVLKTIRNLAALLEYLN